MINKRRMSRKNVKHEDEKYTVKNAEELFEILMKVRKYKNNIWKDTKVFYYLKRSRVSIDDQDDIHFWCLELSITCLSWSIENIWISSLTFFQQESFVLAERLFILHDLFDTAYDILSQYTSNVLDILNTSTLSAFIISTQTRVMKSSDSNSRVSSQSVWFTVLNLSNDISCLCHCKFLFLQ